MLLPMELDTAMSPMPDEEREERKERSPRENRRDQRRWRVVTLSSYNQTGHAVWDAGPRCQEGDAHDVIWDV